MAGEAGGGRGEARRGGAWAAAGALAALAAVAVAAAAAGGAGEAAPAGGPDGGEAEGEGAIADAGEAAVGAEQGGGSGGQGMRGPDVVMPSKSSRPGCEKYDACYVPSIVAAAAGGSITWRNDDVAFHTVTSGAYGSPDGAFDSGHLDPGEEFTVSFAEAGAVEYHCTLHPWMAGTVDVAESGG